MDSSLGPQVKNAKIRCTISPKEGDISVLRWWLTAGHLYQHCRCNYFLDIFLIPLDRTPPMGKDRHGARSAHFGRKDVTSITPGDVRRLA